MLKSKAISEGVILSLKAKGKYTGAFAGITKACTVCGTTFTSKRARTTVCLTCRARSPEEIKAARVQAVTDFRRRQKQRAIEYMGGSCCKCGYSKCSYALEFHHTDPTEKEFSLSQTGVTRSWDRLLAELKKCILVCSNCHREIHAALGGNTV